MSAVRRRPSRAATAFLLIMLTVGLASLAIAPFAPTIASPLEPQGSDSRAMTAAAPASSEFTASPNPDDVGVSVTFDASGTCLALVGTCNYSYSGLPSGCSGSSTSSFSCSPSATGQFDVNATATWACPVCVTNSATLTLTVNGDPTVNSVTATPANLDVGQSTSLTVSLSGGSTPFSYAWSQLPSGCSSADSSSLTCQPTETGTFGIHVGIRDSVGSIANGSVNIAVAPQLGVTLSVTPAVRDLGGSVTFSSIVSGGQSPYRVAYASLPAGCTSESAPNVTCTPTAMGTFQVTVTATDSVGSQASAAATLEVVGGPNASLSATPSTLDLGQTLTFVATVSGGSGVYQYAYANLPTGCSAGNQSTFTCTPTVSGAFSVVLTVTDSQGGSATATTSVTINPRLAVAIDANVTAGLTPLAVSFAANLSGGTAPFRYAWLFAPNATSNLTDPQFVFVTSGNYSVSLTVTDAIGSTLTAVLVIEVAPTANLLTFPISFFVNPSGCGPISMDSFLLRDGSSEALPAATYPAIAPSCPGFAFTQWVPSGGLLVSAPANASTTITIKGAGSITAVLTAIATHGAPPTGGFGVRSASSWIPFIPLLVGAVLALYVMKRYLDGRRAERAPPTGGGPTGPTTPPHGRPEPRPTPGGVPSGATGGGSGVPGERPVASVGPTATKAPPPSPWVPPVSHYPATDRSPPAGRPGSAKRPPVAGGLASRPATPYAFSTAPPTGSNGPAPAPVRSPIAPPPPRRDPVATTPSSMPTAGVGGTVPAGTPRSWPPSRIWDISPTPNSPKKVDSRRAPPDGR